MQVTKISITDKTTIKEYKTCFVTKEVLLDSEMQVKILVTKNYKSCSVAGCPRRMKSDNLCSTHYQQVHVLHKKTGPIRNRVTGAQVFNDRRECTKCRKVKPNSQFYLRKNGKAMPRCKECFLAVRK